ncbi:MAG TPA: exodeoxyribonuclease V subunit beta [Chthoniobacteraceae bacterium]|jgi:exodeoxyribonuclease V beta subunit|nr:exodeoxyribonuclease V subunit beta [Chthoniobacteraceae bacterium]
MNAPAQFDLAGTPLVPGITVIEASAGTGKTYTIAGIILRLVMEQNVPINEILAVTYTIAATGELRDRVRSRLRDALRDLRAGAMDFDGDIPRAIKALEAAVQNFDEAQIFTIHGVCKRMLDDNAFESGLLFDMELMPDADPMREEVARDFWRRTFYEAPSLIPRLALARKRSPDQWLTLLRRTQNHPDLLIIPGPGEKPGVALAADLDRLFEQIRDAWPASREAVCDILENDKNLSHARENFSAERCEELRDSLERLCSNFGESDPDCLLAIEDLAVSEIKRCTNKNKTTPEHPFFNLCQDFSDAANAYFRRLDHEFLAYAGEVLPARKARLNALTYDDLLLRLRAALLGAAGPALAEALGDRYRVALIDEFQDTDPVQYEIFHRVFGGGRHQLYLIGDPKQAIYAFRGADVYTYLDAVGTAQRRFTLTTNYRSSKPLLDGINKLFDTRKPPFLVKDIEYHAVNPPLKPREGFAALDDATPPLRFRYAECAGKALKQEDAARLVNHAVTADIARLKAGGLQLGDRPLAFGDMAILVRSNKQVAKLQQLLREKGIHSVLKSDQNVFATEEACHLSRFLAAVLRPGRDALLKTALATRIAGLTATRVAALDTDEAERSVWLERFLGYRTIWENGCFIALFRHLLIDLDVRAKLLRGPGGERRLTNHLHLAELLHRAETAQRLTPEALCAWLRKQRAESGRAEEEQQLRLESDEDAVLISTIHKSKGLEYPVVFCPFLWRAADSKTRTQLLYHDPDNNHRLTLDMRGRKESPEHDAFTADELMAEALRLLYVAVTRAKNRCHVYTGDFSGFDKSALGYLLETPRPAIEAPGAIEITQMEADESILLPPGETAKASPLAAREFSGPAPAGRMIASFTGLVSGQTEETPDRDAVEIAEPAAESEGDLVELAAFERGARAGDFIHEVLEQLDFQKPAQLDPLIPRALAGHGIAPGFWPEKIRAQILRLLETSLAPGITLGGIGMDARRSEVEFSHPLAPIQPRELQALFSAHAGPDLPAAFPAHLGRLKFHPVEGYMRGFIDLLFESGGRYYIVDWKSNWLGNRRADYDQRGIAACMLRHSYYLQFHLYTLATDLFLRSRLPGYAYDRHFGGVFYIFLRGVDPAMPERGIHRARPSAALVAAMRRLLIP